MLVQYVFFLYFFKSFPAKCLSPIQTRHQFCIKCWFSGGQLANCVLVAVLKILIMLFNFSFQFNFFFVFFEKRTWKNSFLKFLKLSERDFWPPRSTSWCSLRVSEHHVPWHVVPMFLLMDNSLPSVERAETKTVLCAIAGSDSAQRRLVHRQGPENSGTWTVEAGLQPWCQQSGLFTKQEVNWFPPSCLSAAHWSSQGGISQIWVWIFYIQVMIQTQRLLLY